MKVETYLSSKCLVSYLISIWVYPLYNTISMYIDYLKNHVQKSQILFALRCSNANLSGDNKTSYNRLEHGCIVTSRIKEQESYRRNGCLRRSGRRRVERSQKLMNETITESNCILFLIPVVSKAFKNI